MMKHLIVTTALVAFLSITAKSQDRAAADSIYTTVDVQPEFPGGYKALGKYIDGMRALRLCEMGGEQMALLKTGQPGELSKVPINMDTDDLSREAYKAVIIEAEKFSHDLTLQFGVLASECDNENEYLQKSRELIEEMRALGPENTYL